MEEQDLIQDNEPAEPALQLDDLPVNKLNEMQKLLTDARASKTRTWSYYQTLKKDDPTKYWSSRIQNQMHEDAINNPNTFPDGDF